MHLPSEQEDLSSIPAPTWEAARWLAFAWRLAHPGAFQPASQFSWNKEVNEGPCLRSRWSLLWNNTEVGHRPLQELACGFSRSGPSFLARRPVIFRAQHHSLFSLWASGTPSWGSPSFLAFLSFVLLSHPLLFCSFLSFCLSPLLRFGQPLNPGQFKRPHPHPGSPMEQGCSVHIRYPVAGCHLKALADTSQARPSDRKPQRLDEPIAAQELQVSPRLATHRNYKLLKPFVFTARTISV